MSIQVALQEREDQVTNALQLDNIKNQLADLLNSNPQKMQAFKTRMVQMACSDMLKGCTPESLIECGMQALTLNLPLAAGQGYIVKYKNVAQLDIGYRGWQLLAERSGFEAMGSAVYNCDFFEQKGFNFDAVYNFEPNHSERKTANDDWVKKNIKGVIVSIRRADTGTVQSRFVEKDMILKIVGMSPSASSDFSPHNKWAETMMIAKSLKHVLSKLPVDLSKGSDMVEAFGIVNNTESTAQAAAKPAGLPEYSAEKFEANWPKWVALVETGRQLSVTIITQLSNGYSLTEAQMTKVMTLSNHEPIEGEVADADMAEAS